MVDFPFKIGDEVTVTAPIEDSSAVDFLGQSGAVVAIDPDDDVDLTVFVKFPDGSGGSLLWLSHNELSQESESPAEETLEAKRDRLKAELAVAEAELHDALRPQASKLPVGTIVRLWDRANNTPILHIKQGPDNWTRVGVSKSREDNMPTSYLYTDFDTQPFINTAWDTDGSLDIRPGK